MTVAFIAHRREPSDACVRHGGVFVSPSPRYSYVSLCLPVCIVATPCCYCLISSVSSHCLHRYLYSEFVPGTWPYGSSVCCFKTTRQQQHSSVCVPSVHGSGAFGLITNNPKPTVSALRESVIDTGTSSPPFLSHGSYFPKVRCSGRLSSWRPVPSSSNEPGAQASSPARPSHGYADVAAADVGRGYQRPIGSTWRTCQ